MEGLLEVYFPFLTSFYGVRYTNKLTGSGTYSDPETFATAMDNTNFKECEIVYIPYLQKYFRYNDHCEQCSKESH